MNMPFLYDNNYEILFFTINNDLNTDVIKKRLTEPNITKKYNTTQNGLFFNGYFSFL